MKKVKFHSSVVASGWLSFLTDTSSEMIYTILPFLLTGTLGASPAFVGLVDGIAEAVAAFIKIFSGHISDRLQKRKTILMWGYSISAIARSFFALATSPLHVLGLRVFDRVGKGVRGAPRDALIADFTPKENLAQAFGYTRTLDNLGAALGPTLAFIFLYSVKMDLKTLLWWGSVPGLMGVVVAYIWIKEPALTKIKIEKKKLTWLKMDRQLKVFFLATLLFSLGTGSGSFFLLRAQDLGIPLQYIPLLWAVHNLARSFLAQRIGHYSDKVGRQKIILLGWLYFSLMYFGFSQVTNHWGYLGLIIFYGFFFAMTEGSTQGFVAQLAPADKRASVLGLYAFLQAIVAIPSGILFGELVMHFGYSTAFLTGSILTLIAALLLRRLS